MEASIRPVFVTRDWLQPGRGFTYGGQAPVELSTYSSDSDDWIRLLALFERLKKGMLHEDVVLLDLVRNSQNREIRECGLKILGHCAGMDCRRSIGGFFDDADVDVRMAAYEAAMLACDLRLVDALLVARRKAKPQERLHIMSAISHLLEPEPAELYDDLDELPADVYEARARARAQGLKRQYGSGVPIFEGTLLSLPDLVRRIETLCDAPDAIEYSGWISRYVDIFEAMTGTPSVDTFDEEATANCYRIREMIAGFERTGAISHFEPGYRYFFGHKLSS